MKETEIGSELPRHGITQVEKITLEKENKIIKTGTCILTFNLHQHPEGMQIGYLSVSIEIFIPNPHLVMNLQDGKTVWLTVQLHQSAWPGSEEREIL